MVSQKVRTNIYLDESLKIQAKEIYKHYGITLSDAVNMFLAQSVFNQGLPFDLKIPNDKTLQAMKDVKSGENYEDITIEDLKK